MSHNYSNNFSHLCTERILSYGELIVILYKGNNFFIILFDYSIRCKLSNKVHYVSIRVRSIKYPRYRLILVNIMIVKLLVMTLKLVDHFPLIITYMRSTAI